MCVLCYLFPQQNLLILKQPEVELYNSLAEYSKQFRQIRRDGDHSKTPVALSTVHRVSPHRLHAKGRHNDEYQQYLQKLQIRRF